MIIICEECGKKYKIDPSKIRGKAAGFKCRTCTHFIVVSKPTPTEAPRTTDPELSSETKPTEVDNGTADIASEVAEQKQADGKMDARRQHGAGGFGLRAKMLLVFLFLPVILVVAASLLYLQLLEFCFVGLVLDSIYH